MNTSDVVNNPSPTHSWITSVISGIAIVGLVINGLLVFQSLSGDSIVGCGGDSSCHDVLNSRWSSLLGIPVAILGFLLYLVFLIALYRKNLLVLYICLGLILGAVAWFVFVQTVIIGRFCLWCMAAHGVGVIIFCLTLWREKRQGNGMPAIQIGGSFAAMSSVVIGLMQFFGPLPVTHRVEDVRGEKDSRSVSIHAREEGRKVAFDSGRMIYNVKTLPHMGKSDAKHVLVEYFDFQCSSCRIMRRYLMSLVEKYPEDICVILLPVPLDRGCNPQLPPRVEGYDGSCEITRIALAVWQLDPEIYRDIHQKFLAENSLTSSQAMDIACEKISRSQLDEAIRDPWIDELIRSNISHWTAFSSQNHQLPKLLIKDRRILHGLPSGEADFIRVMEQELGIQSN